MEASIEAITSGDEAGRGVDDHEVVARPQQRVELAEELDRHRAGLVRPHRRHEHARPARVRRQVGLDLLRVERPARLDEVVDRPLRGQSEREPDVAELQVEVDDHDALAQRAPAPTARLALVSVLPMPPLGPSTQISDASAGGARGRALRCAARRPSRRAKPSCSADRVASPRRRRRASTRSSAPASNACRTKPVGRRPEHSTTIGRSGCSRGGLADEPQRLLGVRARRRRAPRRARGSPSAVQLSLEARDDRGDLERRASRASSSRTLSSSTPASSATSVEIGLVIDIIALRPSSARWPAPTRSTGMGSMPSSSRSRFVSDGVFCGGAGLGPQRDPELAVVGRERQLDGASLSLTRSTTFWVWLCWASPPVLRAGRRRVRAPRRPGGAPAAPAAAGRCHPAVPGSRRTRRRGRRPGPGRSCRARRRAGRVIARWSSAEPGEDRVRSAWRSRRS